jgi:hypothetical protein
METGIIVAGIAAVASLLGAAASFFFSLRREHAGDWRKVKFEHYREFMTALSSITGSDATPDGHRRFAQASNTIQLIAPKRVIDALHAFREEIAVTNPSRSPERQAILLSKLIREIRADLGVPRRANSADLTIRFWVSGVNADGG